MKSCHASGKTHNAARIALWALMRWPEDNLILTTAPTFRQVKVLWGEIADARKHARYSLPEPNATELKLGDKRYIVGVSTNDPNKFQSYHARHVLIIVDEAQGVLQAIWDAIEGIRAGGDVRVLMQGNPTISGGMYGSAWGKEKRIWNGLTISAFDTPNFSGLRMTCLQAGVERVFGDPNGRELVSLTEDELAHTKYPYLITPRWVKERLMVWGADDWRFISRVLGEFPPDDPQAIFPRAWLERASEETTEDQLRQLAGEPIQVGIDVAGGGSAETVMVARVGACILPGFPKFWPQEDPRGEIARELSILKADRRFTLGPVVIDAGGVGLHMGTHFADLRYDVYRYLFGQRPLDAEQYVNLKAEMYWGFRERLQESRVYGLVDQETRDQFANVHGKPTSSGKNQVESKEDARKRGIESPDRAEACVMAFARIIPRVEQVDFTAPYVISRI